MKALAVRRLQALEVAAHGGGVGRQHGGDWAIEASVASSPLKYVSMIVPARMTRARASFTALRRAVSY